MLSNCFDLCNEQHFIDVAQSIFIVNTSLPSKTTTYPFSRYFWPSSASDTSPGDGVRELFKTSKDAATLDISIKKNLVGFGYFCWG